MSGPLHDLTIAEAAPRIQAQELSPVALTEAFLARIAATDGQLHSYVLVTAERALADAKRAERDTIQAGLRNSEAWRAVLPSTYPDHEFYSQPYSEDCSTRPLTVVIFGKSRQVDR